MKSDMVTRVVSEGKAASEAQLRFEAAMTRIDEKIEAIEGGLFEIESQALKLKGWLIGSAFVLSVSVGILFSLSMR